MSMWYGAALGFRPIAIIRNFTQNLWNTYPRVGGKATAEGFRMAQTPEGFKEALDAGAFSLGARGVIGGDEIFHTMMKESGVTANNIASRIIFAGPMNAALKLGRPLQRAVGQSLKGFGAADIHNRVWAYQAQKAYVMPFINRWQGAVGKPGERAARQALEKSGLEYWGAAERNQFLKILDRDGSNAAVRYIGRQAADVTQYIYGLGSQPLLLQRQIGRLFGTFGTWPLWQLDLLRSNFRNASLAGKFKLGMRYGINMAAITSMGAAWGVNIASWIAPVTPLNYAGGPMAQFAMDLKDVISSPMAWKKRAAINMATNYGRLTFPGQIAARDFQRGLKFMFDEGNPYAAFASIALGNPLDIDENPFTNPDWGMNTLIPAAPQGPLVPDTGTQAQTQSSFPGQLPIPAPKR